MTQSEQIIMAATVDMVFTLYFFPSSSSILYSVIVLIFPLIVSFGEGSVAVNENTKTMNKPKELGIVVITCSVWSKLKK